MEKIKIIEEIITILKRKSFPFLDLYSNNFEQQINKSEFSTCIRDLKTEKYIDYEGNFNDTNDIVMTRFGEEMIKNHITYSNYLKSKSNETLYDRVVKWGKNNFIVVSILLILTVLTAIGSFNDLIDKIMPGKDKPKPLPYIDNHVKAIAGITLYLKTPTTYPDYTKHLNAIDKDILPMLSADNNTNITSKVEIISKTLKIYSYLLSVENKINNPGKQFLNNENILKDGLLFTPEGKLRMDSKYLVVENKFNFDAFAVSIDSITKFIKNYKAYLSELSELDFSICNSLVSKEGILKTLDYLAFFEANKVQAVVLIRTTIEANMSKPIEWDNSSNGSKMIIEYIFGNDLKDNMKLIKETQVKNKECLDNSLKTLISALKE